MARRPPLRPARGDPDQTPQSGTSRSPETNIVNDPTTSPQPGDPKGSLGLDANRTGVGVRNTVIAPDTSVRPPLGRRALSILRSRPVERSHEDRPGSIQWLLFQTSGRISRTGYWIGAQIQAVVAILLAPVYFGAIAVAVRGDVAAEMFLGLGFFGVVVVTSVWITVKRWHDRDKSGWWVLIAVVPIIGYLWAVIEPGFLAGTGGPNRFGEEPIQVITRRR